MFNILRKIGIIVVFILLISQFPFFNVYAAGSTLDNGYWTEVYNDFCYRKTNFGDIGAENYLINTFVIKLGTREMIFKKYDIYDTDTTTNIKSCLYYDIYGRLEIIYDFLSQPWNQNIYSNNEKAGIGLRLKYEKLPDNKKPDIYLSGELVAEYLHLSRSWDTSKQDFSSMNHDDIKLGLHTWNTLENMNPFFGEISGDLYYHSSNFANINQNDYLILTINPRFGLFKEVKESFILKSAIYATFEYISDFNNNGWNNNPYNNNTKYGIGIQVLLKNNINIYIEQLWINYHPKADPWPIANQDLKIGVQINYL
jgi:hypothetical protein